MHLAVSLVALAAVLVTGASAGILVRRRRRARRESGGAPPCAVVGRCPLPEGHRPPPGLGPLSPSERFLTTEAARGLRELQVFLLDQQAA